jgi:predicted nucleic acid-binding protein
MRYLVDTNILLLAAQPTHPMNEAAARALKILMERDESLAVAIQNIAEFWDVATRPSKNNGLGFTIEEAKTELAKLEGFFEIVSENTASYAAWKTLVTTRRVSGVEVHDARLAAVMKAHGITKILTFNNRDFARFDGIEAILPDQIA